MPDLLERQDLKGTLEQLDHKGILVPPDQLGHREIPARLALPDPREKLDQQVPLDP
jgi:hypothetical protein